MTRTQYAEKEKARYLSKWRSSGQSAAGFAAVHGIKESTFYKWLAKAKKATSGGFVELSAAVQNFKEGVAPETCTETERLFIRAKGVELEIACETPVSRVAELLKEMASL